MGVVIGLEVRLSRQKCRCRADSKDEIQEVCLHLCSTRPFTLFCASAERGKQRDKSELGGDRVRDESERGGEELLFSIQKKPGVACRWLALLH